MKRKTREKIKTCFWRRYQPLTRSRQLSKQDDDDSFKRKHRDRLYSRSLCLYVQRSRQISRASRDSGEQRRSAERKAAKKI